MDSNPILSQNIQKSFTNFSDLTKSEKDIPIGTKKQYKDGLYEKTDKGWRKVKEGEKKEEKITSDNKIKEGEKKEETTETTGRYPKEMEEKLHKLMKLDPWIDTRDLLTKEEIKQISSHYHIHPEDEQNMFTGKLDFSKNFGFNIQTYHFDKHINKDNAKIILDKYLK